MQQSVQECVCKRGGMEELAPLREWHIGCYHRAVLFVPFCDELEEHVGLVLAYGHIANLVYDEHLVFRIYLKPVLEPVLIMRLPELVYELLEGYEICLVPRPGAAYPDGGRKVGLLHSAANETFHR